MKTVGLTLLIAIALALSGCKKDEGGEKAADDNGEQGTATDKGGDDKGGEGDEGDKGGEGDDGGEGDEGDGMVNKMKHCPNAIEGAKTTVQKTKDRVVVSVEVGEGHVDEVVSRIEHLQGLKVEEPDEVEHSGDGTGGGQGKCPVVTTLSKIEKFEAKGGTVKIHIAPNKAEDLDRVHDTVKERAEALAAEGGAEHEHGSGQGGGKGGGSGKGEGDKDKQPSDDKGAAAKSKRPKKPAKDKDEGGW